MLGRRWPERGGTGRRWRLRRSRADSWLEEEEDGEAHLVAESAWPGVVGGDGELDDGSGGQELDSGLGLGFGGEQRAGEERGKAEGLGFLSTAGGHGGERVRWRRRVRHGARAAAVATGVDGDVFAKSHSTKHG